MKKQYIGEVGVDSGQLMIVDPCYIHSHWEEHDRHPADFAHDIYVHEDCSYWQYGGETDGLHSVKINSFSDYQAIIPEYRLSANDLIARKKFKVSSLAPRPHIPNGEFSYRGICKDNFLYSYNHPGLAFCSGFGDGAYPVYAQIEKFPHGKVIRKITIEFY